MRPMGFWNSGTDAFFYVWVFHRNAESYRNSFLPSLYQGHEIEKNRHYGRRALDVEHTSFTPLVFTTRGGMGREATATYKCLASLIAERHGKPYSWTAIDWIRRRLLFSQLRTSLLCVCGSRRRLHD